MENIFLYIISALLIMHILTSIYVYISIVNKKKAGFFGILLSIIPIINILIYKEAKLANRLNDIEIMRQYVKDEQIYNNFLLQLETGQITMKEVKKQIQNDLDEKGLSSIKDAEKSMATLRFIGQMQTTLLMQSALNKAKKQGDFLTDEVEIVNDPETKSIKELTNTQENKISIGSSRKISSMDIFGFINIITFLIISYWYNSLESSTDYNYIIAPIGIVWLISLLINLLIAQLRKIQSQINAIKHIDLYAKLSAFCSFFLSLYILFHLDSITDFLISMFIFSLLALSLSWIYDKFNE